MVGKKASRLGAKRRKGIGLLRRDNSNRRRNGEGMEKEKVCKDCKKFKSRGCWLRREEMRDPGEYDWCYGWKEKK